jgi:predicted nucleotidyltransferase component of viral defense system
MMSREQSVLQKLKNKARKKRLPFQLVLQLFCQEEFLRRLSKSLYNHKLILKGGLFLFSYSGFEGRPTMDIDFLAKSVSNNQEDMKMMIEEIINVETESDFVTFNIKSLENIAEHKAYPGVRIKLIASIANTRTPFDIDIGIGDVIVPEEKFLQLQTQLEGFNRPMILTYSLESTIAEKLEAMFSRMEVTSRMKDYYDIFYLASNYDFDGSVLMNAILMTFRNRDTECDLDSLNQIGSMHKNDDMKKKWDAFSKKSLGVDLDFIEVIDIIVRFIEKPIKAIEEEILFEQNWKCKQCEYQ